ncbi:MAG: NAD(P)H-hydrate dehydratase, partial [Elusimicrobiaceae bacterium]|nr:NAD(P)H-hydrate dehydratase [Elusimicrobiaceae bacterium]
ADGVVAAAAAKELETLVESRGFDLVLIGPGLGCCPETAECVRGFLKGCNLPSVIDADALNAISRSPKPENFFGGTGPARILTPHIGEAERLLKIDRETLKIFREQSALKLADLANGVGVLKDFETAIGSVQGAVAPRRAALNVSGSCELSKGGTGDVLAGMVAGLWAQSGKLNGFTPETAFESACAAVYLHGECGTLARREMTEYCLLAGELADWLPKAIRKTLVGE